MKQKTKNIIALIFILILAVEFYVYYSDYNLTTERTFEIGIITLLISITFLFFYFNKWIFRVLIGLPIILIGIVFIFFQFISAFGSVEKISCNWEIENLEIIYATQEYYAGPGSKPYLKLRKKYFFGKLYKVLDKQNAKNTFLGLCFGENNCVLDFEKTGYRFNLCEKKRLQQKRFSNKKTN